MARRLHLLFAALLTVLALAPGPAAADAQNRVGALFSGAPTCTGPYAGESPCTHPGSTTETARTAAGCCVATKAAADDLARRVPPYTGGKTQGALEVGGRQVDLISGRAGAAASIPKGTPGFDAYVRTHVEGHAAAILRQQGGGRAVGDQSGAVPKLPPQPSAGVARGR